MDQNNKPNAGAPSSDTTSALFVSARKKQLEQQEIERRAQEKEEQRRAKEAEVRRLEQEVEERRRRAEMEAQAVAANPFGAPVAPSTQTGTSLQNQPVPAVSQPARPAAAAKQPNVTVGGDRKKLFIIGGGALAAVILVVILIVALGGGGGIDPDLELDAVYDNYGIFFTYPSGWEIAYENEAPPEVIVQSDYVRADTQDRILICNVTDQYLEGIGEYGDAITAGSVVMDSAISDTAWGATYDEYVPNIYEAGEGFVSGSTDLVYVAESGAKFHMYVSLIPCENSLLLVLIDLSESGGMDQALQLCQRIADTSVLQSAGGSGEQEFYDASSGIHFEYPEGWTATQTAGADTVYAPITVRYAADSEDRMLIYNYTPEFDNFLSEGGSGMDNLITDFATRFMLDAGYDMEQTYNWEYSEQISSEYSYEGIMLSVENDEFYFGFLVIKVLSEPQKVVAVAIESKDQSAIDTFSEVAGSVDLR